MERQQQKTFGIVPLSTKDEIRQRVKQKGFKLMLGTCIEVSNDLTLQLNILKKQLPVFAFVLQGKDVVRTWSTMIKQEKEIQKDAYFYASDKSTDVERDISLFQTMSDSSTERKKAIQKKPIRPINESRVPIKKPLVRNQETTDSKPNNRLRLDSSRKVSEGVTKKTSSPANPKRTVLTKGSKTTPPSSGVGTKKVIKARPATESSGKKQPSVERKKSIDDQKTMKDKRKLVTKVKDRNASAIKETVKEPIENEENANEELDTTVKEKLPIRKKSDAEETMELAVGKTEEEKKLQPISHLSTCSSAISDEHDAEVAAATGFMIAREDLEHFKGRSSTLSPNSVTSLPRPETPESHEIRIERISSRPVSKMSNEIVSRIKEMKPRDPTGSKVKSMVEFFMDENLNKWEF